MDIAELREEIARCDRALIELLDRRFALAEEVGRIKVAADRPVVVREVERRVIGNARDEAEALSVSPGVMEDIMQAIIRGSVERQHRVGVETRARGGARVLIVGAGGGMGCWLRRFLAGIGHAADGVDPAWRGLPAGEGRYASLEDAPDHSGYDAVLVAVPLEDTAATLDALAALRPACPVVEIASIKSHVREPLRRLRDAGTPALSLHPMFGPSKGLYEPLTVVHAVLDDEPSERAAILDLLAHPYLDLVSLPLEDHDRLMGWLLGLSHLTGVLFASALSRSGIAPDELRRIASTSFRRQVATSSSVLAANQPALYYEIQRLNPFRGEVYAALAKALGDLTGAVEDGDRDAFAAALERAADRLPPLE